MFDENDFDGIEPDPWFEEGLDVWAERQIAARIAEDAANGLVVTAWETWAA